MVYCVAFNCKTGSGLGVGLFEFPKDEKRRKVWISRIKRKKFRPSKTSRLCAKHFTNDQFVVDPSLAMTIGYKLRKLQLKSDVIPPIFDFEAKKKGNYNADSFKRKRKSGDVAKSKRIEVRKKNPFLNFIFNCCANHFLIIFFFFKFNCIFNINMNL